MSTITVEIFDRWRKITLNRPERLNSLTKDLKEELLSALAATTEDSTCRALLITGAGRGFCAGQDLAELAIDDRQSRVSFLHILEEFYNPVALSIRQLRIPVVCAVNGTAAGAGANLALSCDIVIAAHSAKFIQSFTNIGLVPDTGGTWYLPRLVGDARARGLILLGEPITAEQAQDWGMIWRAVEDVQLNDRAQELVETLAARPTRALAGAKSLLDLSYKCSLQEQLEAEMHIQNEMGNTDDYFEGLQAFLTKRIPEYHGR